MYLEHSSKHASYRFFPRGLAEKRWKERTIGHCSDRRFVK
jgi:hypothetical protein